ncbi:hypothetical protein ACFL06_01935 [Patescibacteria group bacterium]
MKRYRSHGIRWVVADLTRRVQEREIDPMSSVAFPGSHVVNMGRLAFVSTIDEKGVPRLLVEEHVRVRARPGHIGPPEAEVISSDILGIFSPRNLPELHVFFETVSSKLGYRPWRVLSMMRCMFPRTASRIIGRRYWQLVRE